MIDVCNNSLSGNGLLGKHGTNAEKGLFTRDAHNANARPPTKKHRNLQWKCLIFVSSFYNALRKIASATDNMTMLLPFDAVMHVMPHVPCSALLGSPCKVSYIPQILRWLQNIRWARKMLREGTSPRPDATAAAPRSEICEEKKSCV